MLRVKIVLVVCCYAKCSEGNGLESGPDSHSDCPVVKTVPVAIMPSLTANLSFHGGKPCYFMEGVF